MKIPDGVGVLLQVNLLDEIQDALAKAHAKHGDAFVDRVWDDQRLDRALSRALGKAADAQVWLDHACWVQWTAKASTWRGVAVETRRVSDRCKRAIYRVLRVQPVKVSR